MDGHTDGSIEERIDLQTHRWTGRWVIVNILNCW